MFQLNTALIKEDYYNYLMLVSKYWQKNQISIKNGITLEGEDEENGPLYIAVCSKHDLKWFTLIFDLCTKVNTPFLKDDFEKAMKVYHFKFLPKECQSIIKENYQTCYPKK